MVQVLLRVYFLNSICPRNMLFAIELIIGLGRHQGMLRGLPASALEFAVWGALG